MEKSKVYPILYSLPTVEKLNLPSRAEMMPKIESGEIDHLDFRANVFGTGAIKNPYKFRAEDLPRFAASFEGKPFLRNHDQSNIDSRDGTILGCALMEGVFVQDVRLTTRRGMLDYIEGKIDRFSIGWDYQDAICTIAGAASSITLAAIIQVGVIKLWMDSRCVSCYLWNHPVLRPAR